MSKPTPKIFSTFEDWLKENEDLANAEFADGELEIECDECEGTGKIQCDDKDDWAFKDHMRGIYEEQKRLDTKKLEDLNRIIREEAT